MKDKSLLITNFR